MAAIEALFFALFLGLRKVLRRILLVLPYTRTETIGRRRVKAVPHTVNGIGGSKHYTKGAIIRAYGLRDFVSQ